MCARSYREPVTPGPGRSLPPHHTRCARTISPDALRCHGNRRSQKRAPAEVENAVLRLPALPRGALRGR